MSEGLKANVHLNCYRVLHRASLYFVLGGMNGLRQKKLLKNHSNRFSRDKNIIFKPKSRKAYWKGCASQTWKDKSMKYISSKEIFLNNDFFFHK
jgi:hypothetical protein